MTFDEAISRVVEMRKSMHRGDEVNVVLRLKKGFKNFSKAVAKQKGVSHNTFICASVMWFASL